MHPREVDPPRIQILGRLDPLLVVCVLQERWKASSFRPGGMVVLPKRNHLDWEHSASIFVKPTVALVHCHWSILQWDALERIYGSSFRGRLVARCKSDLSSDADALLSLFGHGDCPQGF
jgi:hypothetical protein